ncbi:MAG: enoyl-CoA hydratase/isomerase family protein [Acidimicrobiia bacterium]|nr:enoyl-CoA hydratase/isomerase family protein [Acidimicrobiia bacterium]
MIRWSEPAEHVGLAILDRPERRNALNAELCDDLRGHLEANHQLRAIVIAGEGSAFCAGADIVRRTADHSGLAHGGEDSFRPAFELLCEEIQHHPAPVIAAVHGPAIGAGTQLAVACDYRVAGPGAVFGVPGSKLGVVLSPKNVTRLVQLVGPTNASDLLVTSRYVDRDEANRLGLVTRGVDDTRTDALAFASQIAALAPITVQGHKRAVNLVKAAGALGEAALAEIGEWERRAFLSEDLQEGLAAFAEKRPPNFTGN